MQPSDISWPTTLNTLPFGDFDPSPVGIPHPRPVILQLFAYYVSHPHIYRMRPEGRAGGSDGVIYLDVKTIGDESGSYRRRIVCVVPDSLSGSV